MQPAPFRARALSGGLELDPDMPAPTEPDEGLCGLHVLRHVDRLLESLGMQLVLNSDGEDELAWHLGFEYEPSETQKELRRYPMVSGQNELRRLLRNEPRAVPLLHLLGTQCVGWRQISWEDLRLDRLLQPGRLFLLWPFMALQAPRGPQRRHLHLFAWQAPFPSHSLVTWTNAATLCDGPQPIDLPVRQAAGYIFRHPEPIQRTMHGGWGAVERWWATETEAAVALP